MKQQMFCISIGDAQNGVTGGTTRENLSCRISQKMLQGRGFRNDDVSTLRSIESWISTQEMAELYGSKGDGAAYAGI